MSCQVDNVSGVRTYVVAGSEEDVSGVDPKGVTKTLNAEYIEIQGPGHYHMLEEPQLTADTLRRILRDS